MRIGLLALAVACSSDHELARLGRNGSGWEDPTKASTVGTRFLVAFPWMGEDRALIFRSDRDTEARVLQLAAHTGLGPDRQERFDIAAGLTRVDLGTEPWVVSFPIDLLQLLTRDIAVFVDTEAPVELLVVDDPARDDPAISRVLPVEELGRTYRVVLPWTSRAGVLPTGGDFPGSVHYTVVALEGDTEVLVPPRTEAIRLDGGEAMRIGLLPEEVTTEQSWQVSADKPIAVFSGGMTVCRDGPSGWAGGGATWEQLPPSFRWGTEYVALPVPAHPHSELLLVADQAATAVSVDCREVHMLEAGEVLRLDLVQPRRIRSTLPILAVSEAAYRDDCFNGEELRYPGMASLTPQALYRSGAAVAPLEMDWGWRPPDEDEKETTIAAVAADPEPVGSKPSLEVTAIFAAGETRVDYLNVDQPSTLLGDRLRGLEYAVGPTMTHMRSLGYDCVGCADELTEPKACE